MEGYCIIIFGAGQISRKKLKKIIQCLDNKGKLCYTAPVFKIIALFSQICQVKVVLICVWVSFCFYVGTNFIFQEAPDDRYS